MYRGVNKKRLTFGKYKGRLLTNILHLDQKWIKSMIKLGRLVLPKHFKE